MWRVEYQKRFLKELAALPNPFRKRIETFAFNEMPGQNPFGLGCIEKMAGYPDKYKARFGEFRAGLTIYSKSKVVRFERVGNRKEIYRTFP
ncbi:MAG: type II toxin-antitoxin system RelE/ParE family toxin [Planctomycetota bacterium]